MANLPMYRLDDYLLIEYADGSVWWKASSGLGMERSGACTILGNILVMGCRRSEGHGFLKLEFFDLLSKQPLWDKTPYYCVSSSIFDCNTGLSVDDEQIRNIAYARNRSRYSMKTIDQSIYRLGRYRISVAPQSTVSWETYGGNDTIVGGSAVVESGVLVLGFRESEVSDRSKKAFLDNLRSLPKWVFTELWCHKSDLRPCSSEEPVNGRDSPPSKASASLKSYEPRRGQKSRPTNTLSRRRPTDFFPWAQGFNLKWTRIPLSNFHTLLSGSVLPRFQGWFVRAAAKTRSQIKSLYSLVRGAVSRRFASRR